MKRSLTRNEKQRGNSIVEFALVSVFLVPLLLGTVNVGMNLSRAIQGTQISRDAGHMFARYVDFSETQNKDIIVRLAQGLRMTRTGGNAKVTLSRVMFVGQTECEAAGVPLGECSNFNQPVVTQQLFVGNTNLRPSSVGEPPSDLIDSKGEISPEDYLKDTRTRASGFNAILALQPGEFAYVSETYIISPELDFPGFLEQTDVYSRSIF